MTEQFLEALNDKHVFALAFAAWAYVVWHFGSKITTELKQVVDKIRHMNYMVSNRLTKIEAHLEHNDPNFKPFRNGDSD